MTSWILGAVLLAVSTSGAKACFLIGCALAAAAAIFCAVRGAVEGALGWGAIAFGLIAAWLLL